MPAKLGKLLFAAAFVSAAAAAGLFTVGGWALAGAVPLTLLALVLTVAAVGFARDPQAVATVEARLGRTSATPAPSEAAVGTAADMPETDPQPTAPLNREQRRAAARAARLRNDGSARTSR